MKIDYLVLLVWLALLIGFYLQTGDFWLACGVMLFGPILAFVLMAVLGKISEKRYER